MPARCFGTVLLLLLCLLVLPSALALSVFGAVQQTFTQMADLMCESVDVRGQIDDCAIDFSTVDQANHAYYLPILKNLTARRFSRYFKVNLWKECPFWKDNGMCAQKTCAVIDCDEAEVPQPWLFGSAKDNKPKEIMLDDEDECDEVGSKVPSWAVTAGKVSFLGNMQAGADFSPWKEESDPETWIVQDENEKRMTYVNLQDNPHGFTGYVGAHPRRIWREIWRANCFNSTSSPSSVCLEQRVFHRLVSGMQASVNTHIAMRYVYGANAVSDGTVGKNVGLWVERVGRHPDRLQNLYFSYLFMLRAVARAGRSLLEYDYHTGDGADDAHTRALVQRLVVDPLTHTDICPSRGSALLAGFDETSLFRDPDQALAWPSMEAYYKHQQRRRDQKHQLRSTFRNISRIMDCVGCEKCRLYGKLQLLGLGTALKVLFAEKQKNQTGTFQHGSRFEGHKELHRNEVIALFNTLAEFSDAVAAIGSMRRLELEQAETRLMQASLTLSSVLSLLLLWCIYRRKRGDDSSDGEGKGGGWTKTR